MADDLAAKRYARAAFELAIEAGEETAWTQALQRTAEFFGREEVGSVLANSRVAMASKQELVTAGLRDLPRLPLNFARLLVSKGRAEMASAVAEAFDEMVEERQGIVRAHATTAVPLATGDRQALSERIAQLTGQQVVLETEVDQAILGGMVVLIGDRLIDGSTRSRLRALRNSMVSGRA
jgi:F-type H+-transporting ATPase subunit delta